jgi:hypothetical protein
LYLHRFKAFYLSPFFMIICNALWMIGTRGFNGYVGCCSSVINLDILDKRIVRFSHPSSVMLS